MKIKYESKFAIGAKVYFANPTGLAKIEEDTVKAIIFGENTIELRVVYYTEDGRPRTTTIPEDNCYTTKEECAAATMQMMLL